jgi:hypothetical protein
MLFSFGWGGLALLAVNFFFTFNTLRLYGDSCNTAFRRRASAPIW